MAIEFEAYGHLMDGFWSSATNRRDDAFGGFARQPAPLHLVVIDAVRAAPFGPGVSSSASAWSPTRDSRRDSAAPRASRSRSRLAGSGKFDFLNIIRGRIDTDAALTGVIPITGMRSAPHPRFRRRGA